MKSPYRSSSIVRDMRVWIALLIGLCLGPRSASAQQLLFSTLAEDIAFSPHGQYLAFMTYTTSVVRLGPGPMKVFGLGTLAQFTPVFSPDESMLAATMGEVFAGGLTGTRILTHKVPEGPVVSVFPSALHGTNRANIRDMHWLPDGASFLCLIPSGAEIRRFSAADGRLLMSSEFLQAGSYKLSLSHSTRRIVSASENGLIYIWSLNDLSLQHTLTNQIGPAAFAVISEDGKTIYSGAENDDLRSYSTSDRSETRKVKAGQNGVRELAVDGEQTIVLTRGYDGTAKGWTAGEFRHLFTVPVGEPAVPHNKGSRYPIHISPDGSLFATAGRNAQGRLFTIPLTVTTARREGQELKLEWCGGRPPFRLQQRASLSAGDWEDASEDLHSRRLSVPVAGSRFYRITSEPWPEPLIEP